MTRVSNPARFNGSVPGIPGPSSANGSSGLNGRPRGSSFSHSMQTPLKPVHEDEEEGNARIPGQDVSGQGSERHHSGKVGSVREATNQLIHKLDYSTFRFPTGESSVSAMSYVERTRGAFSITRLAFIGLVLFLLILLTVGVIVEIGEDRIRNRPMSDAEVVMSPAVAAFSALKQQIIRTKHFVSAASQKTAVDDLVSRLFPSSEASRFSFIVIPGVQVDPAKEGANITSTGDQVTITGNSGVACAWALYHFLKYHCGCHVSWSGRQLNLPALFPVVSYVIHKASWLQYYQNTCTSSYSFVWWDWARWEQEIDWMVLQGINFPLAFTGQEEIWRRVYSKHGLTDEDLGAFFGGPAFLAWSRMGNIKGWGGPLPREWMSEQLELQKKILNRMQNFGMSPILPAFNGIIPDAMLRIYPSLNTTRMVPWGGFPDRYTSTLFLDPDEPLFLDLGSEFISEMRQEYQYTSHFYNVDTFNENRPAESNSTDYIRKVADATFNAMTRVDPEAIWVMQAWLFFYDPTFWTPERTEALLTAVPLGRMVLLDLNAEDWATYNTTNFFYGQPFIWCMLHNFGGVSGMFGRISSINQGPSIARTLTNSTMVGTGLTPEGINQNDMIYELMNEMSWRTGPVDLDQWVRNYTIRRYGQTNMNSERAHQILQKSVYDCPYPYHHHGEYSVILRPAFNLKDPMWYDGNDVLIAWELMLRAVKRIPKSDTLIYDLIDISRQNLQIIFHFFYTEFSKAFSRNQIAEASQLATAMQMILSDMDHILKTDSRFTLDAWVTSARSWGRDENQTAFFEYNALNQVTLWGPDGEVLDYGAKQWSGLIANYYLPRWELFLTRTLDSLKHGTPFDQGAFDEEVFQTVEQPFTFRHYAPSTPKAKEQMDPYLLAEELYEKYRDYRKLSFPKFQSKISG